MNLHVYLFTISPVCRLHCLYGADRMPAAARPALPSLAPALTLSF